VTPAPKLGGLAQLPVGKLCLGDDFRIDDDPEDVAELAGSIAQLGVLQPLVVRPKGKAWEVVDLQPLDSEVAA
jgi:ParB-like chromosome segregation protein Spo0J